MGLNKSAIKGARDFVAQSDPGCRLCENFGTHACPASAALLKMGAVGEKELAQAVKEDQSGQSLTPCPKS